MQRELKNKKSAVIFWVLSAICMGVIFMFSSFNAENSTNQSNIIVQLFMQMFGPVADWVLIVRKTAHFLEFAGLCFLLNFALLYTRGKISALPAVLITSLYAASDEAHQLLIDGRSGEIKDWALDTSGALFGLLCFCILFAIIYKRKQKQ